MERSSIKLLKKRGNSNTEISRVLGRDRKTIERVLGEPADKEYKRKKKGSKVDSYEGKIREWIKEEIPVVVMLERVRKDPERPYSGGNTVFYDRVREIRRELERSKKRAIWRFEGLAGEYLQVDWGEKRKFPFERIPQETRYCFVGRLKYSRWIYTEFCIDMRYETLIRCILRCFEDIGGIPWVLIFDNMKTVTEGRDTNGKVIFNPRFEQFASEIGFHPELCDYDAANQKGTVENGVKYVKRNFLAGRRFLDDEDLSGQLRIWLGEKNNKESQAHGKIPKELLQEEQGAFGTLMESSDSYGISNFLRVTPESVIRFETNYYSVPEELIGQIVTVRVGSKELRIYHDSQLVAKHQRSFERKKWIRDLSHYEKTLTKKPRAKVMAYREKLLELDKKAELYISEVCRRDRNVMNQQILKLYSLWKENGTERFLWAIRSCYESRVYGAEYVELMLKPIKEEDEPELLLFGQPTQSEIDRDLSIYERFIHR